MNGQSGRITNDVAYSTREKFSDASGLLRPELCVSYGYGDEDLVTLYSAEDLPHLKSLKTA